MNLIGKKAHDPEFWSVTVRNNPCYKRFLDDRHADWLKYCEGKTITTPIYSAFKEFTVSGNRSIYENPYFTRRGQLATSAVMALIYPEEEKYIDFLNDIIFAICDEYTWSVSAHHPDLDVYNKTHLDLFSSETGFALAEIYVLLGDRLDKLIAKRIEIEINERIINSFINNPDFFWWETRCTNNWASVCGGSIGCTFMLMRPDLFDTVKPRLDKIMESYLSGFKDDGYCLEGTSYWHYGFGFFVTYADMLKSYTNGKEDYFAREKVKTISTFIQKMYLSGQASVSFADGDLSLKYHIGTLHYLKQLYPDDVKVYSPEISYTKDGCSRFCLLLGSAIWLDEDVYNNPTPNTANAEYYADESQWFVKRTANYGFAAKGGNNNEHHNHNDVGTFIFAKDGEQLITDMGRGVYVKQYFRNETRYNFIECSSLGHNVPYFGEKGAQKLGKLYAAKDVTHSDGTFSMDIADAYGNDAVRKVKRSFTATDTSVKLKDIFDTDEAVTERLVSLAPPTVEDGKISIKSCTITFDPAICEVSLSEMETTKKFMIYLIDFKLRDGVNEFEIELK